MAAGIEPSDKMAVIVPKKVNNSSSEKITKTEVLNQKTVTNASITKKTTSTETTKRKRSSFLQRILFRRSANELQSGDHHQSPAKSAKIDADLDTCNHQSRLIESNQRSSNLDVIPLSDASVSGQLVSALRCQEDNTVSGNHAINSSGKSHRPGTCRSSSTKNHVPSPFSCEKSRFYVARHSDASDHGTDGTCTTSSESRCVAQSTSSGSSPGTTEEIPAPDCASQVPSSVSNGRPHTMVSQENSISKCPLTNHNENCERPGHVSCTIAGVNSEDNLVVNKHCLPHSRNSLIACHSQDVTESSNDVTDINDDVTALIKASVSDCSSYLEASNKFGFLPRSFHISPPDVKPKSDAIHDGSMSSDYKDYSRKNVFYEREEPGLVLKDCKSNFASGGVLISPPSRRANFTGRRRRNFSRRTSSMNENISRQPLEQILENSSDDSWTGDRGVVKRDDFGADDSMAVQCNPVSSNEDVIQPSVSTGQVTSHSAEMEAPVATDPVSVVKSAVDESVGSSNKPRLNPLLMRRLKSDSGLLASAKHVRFHCDALMPITVKQDNGADVNKTQEEIAAVNAAHTYKGSLNAVDVYKADMNPSNLKRTKLTRMSSLRMFWAPSGGEGKAVPSSCFSTGDPYVERSEGFKDRLLRKREQWRERRQGSGRDIAKLPPATRRDNGDIPVPVDGITGQAQKNGSMEDISVGSGGGDGGKLARWFSLRKSNNPEAGERKTSSQGGATPVPHPAPHPHVGVKNPSTVKEASDELDATLSASSEGGSQHDRNSFSLSTASFSSSSSSSTTSSMSSLPSTTPSSNLNPQPNNPRLPQLTELEERMSELDAGVSAANFHLLSNAELSALGTNAFQRKHQPPNLPPMPPGLTPEQIKRRHIVASIVHSENNYVATLHRLVRDYRKPLEESKPPILSQSKVAILFHYVHGLLQCHTLFRIALTDCVRHWDRDEKIGDVFFACFSKGAVLEIYSEFINNFTRAMELAKLESRKKSIFADFLKDLLKHTPKGHPDRMSLQLALTQLESLAETLNELKRESEQHQAFKATLKQINSKFALRNISEGNRCLIRQDDATKLEFGPNGLIKQTKERRLFLTTDAVICVSVVPKTTDDVNSHERLSLKWVHPITEIEVQENNSSLTLSRLLAAGLAQRTSGSASSSLGKTTSTGGGGSVYDNIYGSVSTSTLMESEAMVGAMCAEMNDLMHDYQVVSRIAGLVSSLKGSYDALSQSTTQGVLDVIQQNIQARDDRMSWLDGCCLQIKAGKDVMTFHVQDPGVKKDWIIELRLAQLAVSSVNSPAWDTGDTDTQRPPSRRPLFVTALPLLHASHHTQVVCGCQYPLLEVPKNVPLKSVVTGTRRRRGKTSTSVWICSTDGVTSYVTRYVTHLGGLRECGRASLPELCVTGMLHVPPSPFPPSTSSPLTPTSPHPLLTDHSSPPPPPLSLDTVWIGTLQNRLLVYSGSAHDCQDELNNTELPAAVSSLIYHCHMVFVGLTNGSLLVYHRSAADGCWLLSAPATLELSAGAAVTALLPLSAQLYAAVANSVVVVDCASLTVLKRLSAHHGGTVSLLAHSGVGLWLSEQGSSTVCLYHTESCRHLQDIDLAPSVSRMLGLANGTCSVVVTALVISRGLLWVGTSLGVTVTLPLPRLQGVPIISGRPTLSYHAHTGPVTFLMTLMTPEYYNLPRRKAGSVPPESMSSEKGIDWESEGLKNPQSDSCTEESKQVSVKRAHTLPRGFGASPGTGLMEDMGPSGPGDEGAVLGLCGDLLRHWTDEGAAVGADGGQEDDLRRSDPSLSLMGSSLDRRLRLRDGRPRSLDLSSASIDSKISALTTTSSGSDDSSTLQTARQSTIREDCDIENNGVDSEDTSARENAGTSTKIVDGSLDTNDVQDTPAVPLESEDCNVDTRTSEHNTNSDSNPFCIEGDIEKESIGKEITRAISTEKLIEGTILVEGDDEVDSDTGTLLIEEKSNLEADKIQEKTNEPSEDPNGTNEHAEESTNSGNNTETRSHNNSTINLDVDESSKDHTSEAEISEHKVIDLESSEGNELGCKANISVESSRKNSSEDLAVSSNNMVNSEVETETTTAASEDVIPIPEFTEGSNCVVKSSIDSPIVTEAVNSTANSTRNSVSLTASVEDVTRSNETRRRTHRRSSSDVTLPVSDEPLVNNRPKIFLPVSSVSSVVPEMKNSEQIRLSPNSPCKGSDRIIAPYSGTSLNRSLGTLSRSPTARSISKNGGSQAADAEPEQPRTVLVLTGGRGYKCIRDTAPTNGPPHNNTDAHILIWEMKL
ncbi:Dbl (DH) domain [Trinorchestia longiramus]|nr:Dbl (DH) domain [Trinorchestia longiramus]